MVVESTRHKRLTHFYMIRCQKRAHGKTNNSEPSQFDFGQEHLSEFWGDYNADNVVFGH